MRQITGKCHYSIRNAIKWVRGYKNMKKEEQEEMKNKLQISKNGEGNYKTEKIEEEEPTTTKISKIDLSKKKPKKKFLK